MAKEKLSERIRRSDIDCRWSLSKEVEALEAECDTLKEQHDKLYKDFLRLQKISDGYMKLGCEEQQRAESAETRLAKAQDILKEDYSCYPSGCDKCTDSSDYPTKPYKDRCEGHRFGKALSGESTPKKEDKPQ